MKTLKIKQLAGNIYVFFFLISSVVMMGCSNPRYINAPSVHNAAFFKQQGDFKFTVAGSADVTALEEKNDHRVHGFDGQAAVAVTNHFMITAGGMYRSERDYFDKDDLLDNANRRTKVNYNRQMFDIGAGFYAPLSQNKKVFFNGVVGVGFGKMESKDNASNFDIARSRMLDAKVTKYFLHPSFNFFFNNYIKMSVAPRFSLLKLSDIQTSYSLSEETLLGYNDARRHTFGLFEPAILLQTGFRNNDWLKLDFGFNFSSDPFTTNKADHDDRPYAKEYNVESRNFLLSVGLSFYPMRKK